jgi:hypothetical protein
MPIFVSLILILSTASAPTTDSAPDTAPPDDFKIVCKTVTATGSRLGGQRKCLPKKEWRRLHESGQEAAREIQDSLSKRPPAGQ